MHAAKSSVGGFPSVGNFQDRETRINQRILYCMRPHIKLILA